jgi:hypothetical protein
MYSVPHIGVACYTLTRVFSGYSHIESRHRIWLHVLNKTAKKTSTPLWHKAQKKAARRLPPQTHTFLFKSLERVHRTQRKAGEGVLDARVFCFGRLILVPKAAGDLLAELILDPCLGDPARSILRSRARRHFLF